MAKTYNLFISHSWAYPNAYNNLVNLLDNRGYFPYKNHSIPIHDPIHTNGTNKELQEAIRRRMHSCHTVLILAGVYSSYSKWINKEIQIANKGFTNPKPIIGIRPRGNKAISTLVQNNALEVVNWNTESIVRSIRTHSI